MNRAFSAGLRACLFPRALPYANLKARLWRSLSEISFERRSSSDGQLRAKLNGGPPGISRGFRFCVIDGEIAIVANAAFSGRLHRDSSCRSVASENQHRIGNYSAHRLAFRESRPHIFVLRRTPRGCGGIASHMLTERSGGVLTMAGRLAIDG